MRVEQARELLGLVNGYTSADVQQAFVRAVKEKHPDAGAVPGVDIGELVVAKDLLLDNQPGEFACPQCDGRGRINLGGVGTVKCGRCNGEGLLP